MINQDEQREHLFVHCIHMNDINTTKAVENSFTMKP